MKSLTFKVGPVQLNAVEVGGFLGLALLCTTLWVCGLGDYYFSGDHALHIRLAKELSWDVRRHLVTETHPPLYYFFLKLAMATFGVDHPLILRGTSLLFGGSAIIVCYLFGKNLSSSPMVGFVSAFLLATSPLFIILSQGIRNYSLLVLLIFCLFVIFQKDYFTLRHWFLAGFLFFLLTLTHYASVLFLPTLFVLGFFKIPSPSRSRNTLFVFSTWGAFLLLNGALTYWMVHQRAANLTGADGHLENLRRAVGDDPFRVGPVLWGLFQSCFGSSPAYVVLGLVLLGSAQLLINQRRQLLILFFGPLLTSIALSLLHKYPLYPGRHSVHLLPVFLVPIIWALKTIREKGGLYLIFLLGLILFTQWKTKPSIYQLEKWREPLQWELGPKFSELQLGLDSLANTKSEIGSIVLEGNLSSSLEMEWAIQPKWAVFSRVSQKTLPCNIWFGYIEPGGRRLCKCLQSALAQSGSESVGLLFEKRWLPNLTAYSEHDSACYQIYRTEELSKKYMLVSLRVKKPINE